jgi:drug/metabolite transporter (DMT)-like permease
LRQNNCGEVKNMKKKALLSVNLAVLLFGLAGLFAKWIHLPAISITFGRVFFSSIALGLFMLVKKQSFRIGSRRDLRMLLCAGAILALHWWSFLASIQLSTVAIGTITFSSFPLFVTFLEPLVFRRRLSGKNIVFALIILLGVIVTVPEFSLGSRMFAGIAVGMLSAFSYAVLTVMNKVFSGRYSGTVTAFYEQAAAAVVLLPFLFMSPARPSGTDLALLLFLGVVTTAAAHTLFISSLKSLPAQLAGLCSSMETVYGILFAFLLLGEVPSLREIIGACVIVGAVIAAQLSDSRAADPA